MHNTKHEHLGPYCKRARSSLKWTFSSAVTIDEIIKHEKKIKPAKTQDTSQNHVKMKASHIEPVADFKSDQQIILFP